MLFYLQYPLSRVCYCGVTSTSNTLLSESSSGLAMGLIPALFPLREAAGKELLCICSRTRIWDRPMKLVGAGLGQWKEEVVPHVGLWELPAVG